MNDSIAATSSTLEALGRQYRAIAHNLANASTAGYKRRCTTFVQDLQQRMDIGLGANGSSVTAGGIRAEISVDFTQGALTRTGRPLDLALKGKGFFVLETTQGPRYTRNGAFRTNQQGQLVDLLGRTVAGEGGPIVIPTSVSIPDLHVSQDGSVLADGRTIGKLRVVAFDEEGMLVAMGGNCFRASAETTANPAPDTVVLQGFREAANVRPVEELVDLIRVTRLYEANIKAMDTKDEKMKNILQVAMS